jgi:hypothetical protein
MSTIPQARSIPQPRASSPTRRRTVGSGHLGRRLVGWLFLWTSGIHVGIVAADTETYRAFADGALPFVRDAWADVFMAHPALWGLAVALGELLIGLGTLAGGRWTRFGLLGAVGFHLCLLLFGWGFLVWVVPALAVLLPMLRREWRTT